MDFNTMTRNERELWTTAYHESGHSVVALVTGIPVLYATAGTEPDEDGALGTMHPWTPSKSLSDLPHIQSDLAGGVATVIAGLDDGVVHDMGWDIGLIAERLGNSVPDVPRFMANMIKQTRALLIKNWRAVQVVAGALYVAGHLTGEEIEKLMRGAGSVPATATTTKGSKMEVVLRWKAKTPDWAIKAYEKAKGRGMGWTGKFMAGGTDWKAWRKSQGIRTKNEVGRICFK